MLRLIVLIGQEYGGRQHQLRDITLTHLLVQLQVRYFTVWVQVHQDMSQIGIRFQI